MVARQNKQTLSRAGKNLLVVSALASCGFLNGGCEDKGAANLSSAQTCLDSARTTDQANACAAQVANDHSADAYLIRCSANFIAQGVTGDRLATAYKQLDSSTSSSNKTTALMAYLIFNDSLAGNTSTETALNCQLSGVSSMYQLASTVGLATTIATLASDASGLAGVPLSSLLPDANGNVDPTALQTALTTLAANLTASGGDPALQTQVATTLGTAVESSADALCGAGSSFASQDVCTKINGAVSAGGGTPVGVGEQIVSLLQAGQ